MKPMFKIGDKVIPINKTADGRIQGLENSIVWKKAKNKGMAFLYIVKMSKEFGI